MNYIVQFILYDFATKSHIKYNCTDNKNLIDDILNKDNFGKN